MFFIDDDDTLESMWILADQTFLTCSNGRELGPGSRPTSDNEFGVFDLARCLGSILGADLLNHSLFWALQKLSSNESSN